MNSIALLVNVEYLQLLIEIKLLAEIVMNYNLWKFSFSL